MNRLQVNIIPTPKKAVFGDGNCTFNFNVKADEVFKKHIPLYIKTASKIFETDVAEGNGGVVLVFDTEIKNGAYKIKADEGCLEISASDDEGILYGIASALQYIDNKKGEVKKVEIEDYTDKPYRGLMVDLARQWHAPYTIFKYIDLCFFYKVKHLHLHFCDNQRYTLPSKKYPKLNKPGNFYTEEEIKSFCEYAKERGVILIPEVEMPGHTKVLNVNYPEIFSCELADDNFSMKSEVGEVITSDNIICAGSEKSYNAICDLVDEALELFADFPYIHFGGDEAAIKVWNNCKHCREYMQKHGLENEKALYSEYTGRMAKYILSKGKTPIVWEGFPEDYMDMIPKETLVILWENHYNTPEALLGAGFKLINCSWKPLYVVNHYVQNWHPFKLLEWNTYNWQHWWPESRACANPVQLEPTEQVLGAQLCAWELTYEQEITRVMENLAVVSERTWNETTECQAGHFHGKFIDILYRAGRLLRYDG